ncbi:hypothetical protein EJB05_51038, partial [Eragrostis curvula]
LSRPLAAPIRAFRLDAYNPMYTLLGQWIIIALTSGAEELDVKLRLKEYSRLRRCPLAPYEEASANFHESDWGSLRDISTRNSPHKRTTSSAPGHAISVSPDGIIPTFGETSNSNVHGKRRKLLPQAMGTTGHVINVSSNGTMSLSAQTSRSNACRKRRQTSLNFSLPDVPPDGSGLGIDDDFPAQFHLPSRKSVRRRMSAPAIDFPRSEASIAANACRKRKAAVAFGTNEENPLPLLRSRHRRNVVPGNVV